MAIKPSDHIIWLDEVGYYQDEINIFGRVESRYHQPRYWQKFVEHATMGIGSNAPDKYILDKHNRTHAAKIFGMIPKQKDDAVHTLLKSYGGEWKRSKSGQYLKFKSAAQMTMFMLKWS